MKNDKWEMARRILQRPFLIDELDLDSGDAIGGGVAGADGSVGSQLILLAGQTNKPPLLEI